ncbi:hypothetical protein SAMN05428949_3598 [Chitinophaga sp. YR627]|uniref:hypothetical protein n=1 Tax=Chitinophaga sp. YR627 TaxID=1881041 RepID=UPI0008DFF093|nr:hypothetical protein [Chitinophaga sp. YR627]SFN83016.1 hypothetical protein SAMN05428949_3598 [Chitinophaga sp. YR627]
MNEGAMKSPEQVTAALNAHLQEKLERTGCTKGRLKAEFTSTLLLSLSCIRTRDNKSMLIWDFDYPLQKAIRDYLEICGPQTAILQVDIDLTRESFLYTHLSRAQHEQQKQAAAREAEKEIQQRKEELKQHLAADTQPIGKPLAEKVATALRHGSIGYTHRDYCGMGLEYREGQYHYGELWDGGMHLSRQSFDTQSAFVQWLSQQSNASLSNIHLKDTFYWGNQVITRERLEQFLQDGAA